MTSADTSRSYDEDLPYSDAMRADEASKVSRWRLIGTVVVLVLVMALALAMRLAPGSATATSGGATVTVDYPRLIVPGTPAPLTIEATFDRATTTVSVQLCGSLVDHLDFQSWYPNPDTETASPDGVLYEFATTGDRFTVRIDARSQPNQWPHVVHCPLVVSTEDARVEIDLRSFVIA